MPSPDGRNVFLFNEAGHHVKTLDAQTGLLVYAFRYDAAGYLIGISDRELTDTSGHETTIQRDAAEVPLSIKSPFGQTTTLSVVGGQLETITDPENGLYKFEYYGTSGLLHKLWDPKLTAEGSDPYLFEFTGGRLTKDTDPLSNSQGLSQTPIENGWRVTRTDQMSRPTTYDTQSPNALTMVSTVTGPDSLSAIQFVFLDGRRADLGPDGKLYSGHQSSPNGYSAFSANDADPKFGIRAPIASSTAEFMQSGSQLLTKYTTRTRNTALSSSDDPSAVVSYTETQKVNDRTQPDSLSYDGNLKKFTTTSPAGRSTYSFVDAHGRTISYQVGTLTPSVFTYDDTDTKTGKVASTDQNDGVIDRKTSYVYYAANAAKMAGYLKSVTRTRVSVANPAQVVAQPAPETFLTDAFGRVTLATTGGESRGFGWDANGNLQTVTPYGALDHTQTHTFFDSLDSYVPPSLDAATPPTPVKTKLTYTPDRLLRTSLDPDSRQTTYTYDPTTGRLSDISAPPGTRHYDYFSGTENGDGQSPGSLKQLTGPSGVNLAFAYLGQLPTAVTWSGLVSGSVARGYDNDFAPISETITDAVGTSVGIQFGYADADKFLTCASLFNCTSPTTNFLSVSHDANGSLTEVDFGTLTEIYTYNSFGALASKTAKLGASPLLKSIYDDPAWALANRRDALGRITHREEFVGNASTPTTFDYQYSAEGRLTDVFLNGSSTAYEHYEYGAQNGNRSVADTPQRHVTAAQTHYDSQDRLTQYGPYSYTYTNTGELKTRTDSSVTPSIVDDLYLRHHGQLAFGHGHHGQAITYLVDGLNRRVAKKVGTSIVRQWLYRDSLKPVAELDGQGHLISTFVSVPTRICRTTWSATTKPTVFSRIISAAPGSSSTWRMPATRRSAPPTRRLGKRRSAVQWRISCRSDLQAVYSTLTPV